jgi:hypothetical protein
MAPGEPEAPARVQHWAVFSACSWVLFHLSLTRGLRLSHRKSLARPQEQQFNQVTERSCHWATPGWEPGTQGSRSWENKLFTARGGEGLYRNWASGGQSSPWPLNMGQVS